MYIYIHTHTPIYIYKYIHIHVYLDLCRYTRARARASQLPRTLKGALQLLINRMVKFALLMYMSEFRLRIVV